MALEAEIAAFEARKADLERHHKDKFVVFHGGDFVGAFDTFDNAAREAVSKFGRGPFLIRQIRGEPPPIPASLMYRAVA